jgi:hypothetical protein
MKVCAGSASMVSSFLNKYEINAIPDVYMYIYPTPRII